MVFCGVCKQEKDTKNRWVIKEHAVDNDVLREFKICDACASIVLRKLAPLIEPERFLEGNKMSLLRSGLVSEIMLDDLGLEITLSMDLAKSRKLILEETDTK